MLLTTTQVGFMFLGIRSPLATDPISNPWTDLASDSLLALVLVTLVVASFRGWVTWPPENRRKDELIERLAEENLNWQRVILGDTLPMIGRTVNKVRLERPQTPDSAEVLRELQAATERLTRVVGQDEH